MAWKTLDDIDLDGKAVLVRVDLNVPMESGAVTDTTRIERIKPTVEDILAKNAHAHSLLERSTIILIASSFVNRAYGATEKTVADLASASFTLKGGMGMYEIVAQARTNPRMIELGTITLEGNKNDQS